MTSYEKQPRAGMVYIDTGVGVAGPILCIGDAEYQARIAGPKPLGGSRTQHRFEVNIADLKRAIADYEERAGKLTKEGGNG
jgi:hypothetical protein